MFYRTVVQVEILSRGQLPEHPSLEYIAHEITEGDCSGTVRRTVEEQVDGPAMAGLLLEQGSDPLFLGLTEDGREA